MITLRSVIQYEQLSGQSLLQLNGDELDLTLLSYCTLMGEERRIPYDEYRVLEGRSPRLKKKREEALLKELHYISQFRSEPTEQESTTDEENGEKRATLSELGYMLIAKGIDPKFVMDEMEIWMLPHILKSVYSQMREELEDKRLWTFLQLTPHRTQEASLQDLFTFPWEREEIEQKTAKEEAQNIEDIELMKQIQ